MKKFISMVMAAAMVVSLVPATAFAVDADLAGKYGVLKDVELAKGTTGVISADKAPELRIKVTEADWKATEGNDTIVDITVTLDNAKFAEEDALTGKIVDEKGAEKATLDDVNFDLNEDKDELTITTRSYKYAKDDVIVLDLTSTMDKTSVGRKATVVVESDDIVLENEGEEWVYATVVDKAFDVSIKKVTDIAVEEVATLTKALKIEAVVGSLPNAVPGGGYDDECDITLKLSKGFEFTKANLDLYGANWEVVGHDADELYINISSSASLSEIEIPNLEIEAVTAKEGDVATITVKADNWDSAKVEVAKVVDFNVIMSVDEDEDVPVMWSGVDANNYGLTVDDTHEALEVTIKETFPGAWSMHKDFTLSLPEGVYVTEVKAVDENNTLVATGYTDLEDVFEGAYVEGEHVYFDFAKRTFDETAADATTPMNECHEMTFVLTLVADPGFAGDVALTLEGDAVETQEVTIATFVSPIVVKAEQNDLKIDYRYTEVPTDIVVTEAEAGLWAKGLKIGFTVDRGDMINFEDDATFTVNEDSEMEIKDKTVLKTTNDDVVAGVSFEVKEESDEEAAVVTISDIELFMQRNIPAGPYDLKLWYDVEGVKGAGVFYDDVALLGQDECTHKDCEANTVCDICDYETVVKEGWINVVTAGREQDDASFTTKVVVPVGESYIVAGETTVALDVPAYVSAAGYTMLPVRAVAVALGINTNNVLWDQATKTVTILYGQRIITMTVGAKAINVNGSVIPASASVEVVDGRTFLPMRDLATALGVTDITWDAATKTATLNGNK